MIVIGAAVILVGVILSVATAVTGFILTLEFDKGWILFLCWILSIALVVGGIIFGSILIAQGIPV